MKKKILSFILSLIIMIGTLSMTITATAIDTSVDTSAKLSEGLKRKMNEYADDEYIPIYVWLDSVGDDVVYQVLSKKAGTEITANTEDAYITSRIENKLDVYKKIELEKQSSIDAATMTAQAYSLKENVSVDEQITSFRNQLQIPAIMTDAEIKTCIESEMPIEKIIEVAERNQFLSDFRGSRKGLNEITNSAFENEIDKTKCKNIFVDPALPFVTMECKKSYIEILAQFTNVTEIGYYEETELIQEDVESAGISSYCVENHMYPQIDIENAGANISIGVIEASKQGSNTYLKDYDFENVHLKGRQISYRPSPNEHENAIVSEHATTVLSIICGTPKVCTEDGKTYQGIAPNATISLAYARYFYEFSEALDWLVDTKKCKVINYSGGTEEVYDLTCAIVDCYVQQYRVVFVTSSGNKVNISTPASSYNSIVVGNFSKRAEASLYEPNSSSYEEQSYLTNKPDLVANGTNIIMLDENYQGENRGSGTSYSAPMVTGTVALMLQANPKLVGKPDAVKTILIQTAEENKISLNNNGFVESIPLDSNDTDSTQEPDTHSFFIDYSLVKTEKAGSGLLNMQGAINGALSGRIISTQFDLASATIGDTWQSEEYYFPVGTDIEMVMVFEKYTHTILTSRPNTNLELSIVSSGGTEVFKSKTVLDNVEVFNVSFATGGYYRFKIKILGLDSTTNDTIPSNLQTGHLSHNILKVSFMFACDCDNSKLVTSSYTETQHNVVCESCNQTILSRESHQTYTYSEGFFTEDGAYSILITHRYYVKNAQILTEQKTVGWAVAPCTYNFPATDATCNISLYSEEYVDDGYEVVYKIDIIKNGVILETFYSNSILVITAEGNATMIING